MRNRSERTALARPVAPWRKVKNAIGFWWESALDIIYSVSLDGNIEDLNPAFEALTGWPVQDWIGRDLGPLIHPEDLSYSWIGEEDCCRGNASYGGSPSY